MDVNEWMSYECPDEGHILRKCITYLLVHIHQNKKIAIEIAAKFASVNFPISLTIVKKGKYRYSVVLYSTANNLSNL